MMGGEGSDRRARFRARYGPWAVVTGASSGIGRAFAHRLAAAGIHVVLVARSEARLAAVAAELAEAYGTEARVIAADLAHDAGIAAVEATTADIDVGILVAAAGFGASGRFLDATPGDGQEMLAVNCGAAMRLSRHFAARFARRGRGGIVLMGSILGFQGAPYAAHYAATKAYIQTLAEALRVEMAPLGVDVIASAPGPVHSGFADRARMRLDRALQPAEVARATLDALGKRATVLPGLRSKALVAAVAPFPRQLRVRIMGRVMRGIARRGEELPATGDAGQRHHADAEGNVH